MLFGLYCPSEDLDPVILPSTQLAPGWPSSGRTGRHACITCRQERLCRATCAEEVGSQARPAPFFAAWHGVEHLQARQDSLLSSPLLRAFLSCLCDSCCASTGAIQWYILCCPACRQAPGSEVKPLFSPHRKAPTPSLLRPMFSISQSYVRAGGRSQAAADPGKA